MAQLYWYCSFCHTANPPAGVFCTSCGHPRPRPSIISKLTPGLLVGGGILFAAGMIFGAIVGVASRPSTLEPRAFQLSSQSTLSPSPSPPAVPIVTNTLAAKKPSPTPPQTPSPTPGAEIEAELTYTLPSASRSPESRTYSRGHLGGCYYINSNGNKTYVDRNLCGSEEPAQPSYVPPPKSSSTGYIRGPRGGCYYINSRGNKTYVDRSMCD